MASKSKIYMVLDFVDGGELFDKIVRPSNFMCYYKLWILLSVWFFVIISEYHCTVE